MLWMSRPSHPCLKQNKCFSVSVQLIFEGITQPLMFLCQPFRVLIIKKKVQVVKKRQCDLKDTVVSNFL